MAYDKDQATDEFTRWSESYDRSILQWLLFGPSHRALIRRIRAVAGDRPLECWTSAAAPGCSRRGSARPCPRPRSGGSTWSPGCWQGVAALAAARRARPAGPGGQRAAAVRRRLVRHRDLRQQLPPLSPPGPRRRRDAPGAAAGGRLMLIDGYRDAPWGWFIYDVCVAGVEGDVHHASSAGSAPVRPGRVRRDRAEGPPRPGAPFLLTEAVARPRLGLRHPVARRHRRRSG